jgi:hypothetical protein
MPPYNIYPPILLCYFKNSPQSAQRNTEVFGFVAHVNLTQGSGAGKPVVKLNLDDFS